MIKDPFEEYIRHIDASKKEKGYAWQTAIGLQDIDGLKPSRYLIDTAIKNIEGEITIDTAEHWITQYYEQNPVSQDENRTEEADKVAVRIARLLSEPAFSFNIQQYLSIHKYLFHGIYPHAGQIRSFNITKKEWVLNGDTVSYGSALELRETLEYDLMQEKKFRYQGLSIDEMIEHLALFVSRLWQIHVFAEGNTRTTAVFFIKYLKTLGFYVSNDSFAENSWYFRNALVRANYNNVAKGIYETSKYVVMFLRNLLLNEHHTLSNRQLHIHSTSYLMATQVQKEPLAVNETRREYKKQDIQAKNQDFPLKKQDADDKKQDIEPIFSHLVAETALSGKTKRNIQSLHQVVKNEVFSRADVIKHLNLTPSPASELLRKMQLTGIIEKISGQGKGKYRFV
ncbi:Fic family protein [Rodentibacter heidelbergensis]|uniref:protein adenylyltransferase n=1 Tax=Rodentibacter heidelbergensis TaxID=1908258 RepID=A0A1V3I6N0_9PAST|nr:Fic family protein [Rodentibacter heidelbergensis]OOF35667.1 cell filamentation protein [Rodentibacter heidelbergensis]